MVDRGTLSASKSITVFTPAYNRADLLPRCYESMLRQTSDDFVWMVIDDGSTDNTRELVEEWIAKGEIEVEYYYKENGGLHTAYNEAIAHLDTPLAVCVDSDDWMPDDAIEKILTHWRKYGSEEYAGIIGLDFTPEGKAIGGRLPEGMETINLIELSSKHSKVKCADRTNVVRTDLYKQVAPQKVFPGEKNFNPHYMHLQISQHYDFLALNECLKVVEYQAGGMTDSMFKQYANSPNSFAEIRKMGLTFPDISLSSKIRQSIHLSSSCLLAHKPFSAIKDNPHKAIAVLSVLPGAALTGLVKWKTRGL